MPSLARSAVPANRSTFAPGSCGFSRSLFEAMVRWLRNPALKPHFPISTATDRATPSRRAYRDCARRSSGFRLTLRSKPSGALDTCWATRRLGAKRTVTATRFCENNEKSSWSWLGAPQGTVILIVCLLGYDGSMAKADGRKDNCCSGRELRDTRGSATLRSSLIHEASPLLEWGFDEKTFCDDADCGGRCCRAKGSDEPHLPRSVAI